jgi:hypothetical protein
MKTLYTSANFIDKREQLNSMLTECYEIDVLLDKTGRFLFYNRAVEPTELIPIEITEEAINYYGAMVSPELELILRGLKPQKLLYNPVCKEIIYTTDEYDLTFSSNWRTFPTFLQSSDPKTSTGVLIDIGGDKLIFSRANYLTSVVYPAIFCNSINYLYLEPGTKASNVGLDIIVNQIKRNYKCNFQVIPSMYDAFCDMYSGVSPSTLVGEEKVSERVVMKATKKLLEVKESNSDDWNTLINKVTIAKELYLYSPHEVKVFDVVLQQLLILEVYYIHVNGYFIYMYIEDHPLVTQGSPLLKRVEDNLSRQLKSKDYQVLVMNKTTRE